MHSAREYWLVMHFHGTGDGVGERASRCEGNDEAQHAVDDVGEIELESERDGCYGVHSDGVDFVGFVG